MIYIIRVHYLSYPYARQIQMRCVCCTYIQLITESSEIQGNENTIRNYLLRN